METFYDDDLMNKPHIRDTAERVIKDLDDFDPEELLRELFPEEYDDNAITLEPYVVENLSKWVNESVKANNQVSMVSNQQKAKVAKALHEKDVSNNQLEKLIKILDIEDPIEQKKGL